MDMIFNGPFTRGAELSNGKIVPDSMQWRRIQLFWYFLFLFFPGEMLGQPAVPYKHISHELEEMLAKDQGPRDTLNALAVNYGTNTDTVNHYWAYIHKIDSLNTIKVSRIIDQYGWPDQRLISQQASKALWLVVQHADSLSREKYLPVLEQAATEGKASKIYLAYLYDRVQMFRERFQLYGTQLGGDYAGNTVLWPVKDMRHLDARRKAMGLSPIKAYLNGYPVSWSQPAYDSLAGKIVFYGLVNDAQGRGLPGVRICEPSGKLIGKTGSKGYFRILASRQVLRKGLLFKGKGYLVFKYRFQNNRAEVFYDSVYLFEK